MLIYRPNVNSGGEKSKCPAAPYIVLAEKCKFIDQQILKLQECPENVNTGEMPRHVQLVVDRSLVGCAVPGTRVHSLGMYNIYKSASTKSVGSTGIRHPYIMVMGIMRNDAKSGRNVSQFTTEQVSEFKHLSQYEDLYERIAEVYTNLSN